MTKGALKTVTRLQGNNAALKHGDVAVAGFDLEFEEVSVLPQAFRRMVRTLEYDVCEMALTTYLCAREHGVKFTAIPVFLVRAFHHGAILVNTESGITHPRQLEGERVGVSRGYTVTTGVWARAVMQEEYGVDLKKITWVLSGDEHVEAYRPPSNVVSIEADSTIEKMLDTGELAAAINIKSDNPKFRPLINDPLAAGLAAYEQRGHYPINHLLTIRDDVLDAHPALAAALFHAFATSKKIYLDKLAGGTDDATYEHSELHRRLLKAGDDPLPYGIEANRSTLNTLIEHAHTQKILSKSVPLETLFAEDTLQLNDQYC